MNNNTISKATLGRLPAYLKYLKDLDINGNELITASKIAEGLKLGEVQVRKDLGAFSGIGKPKLGYNTYELIKQLESYLTVDEDSSSILIGIGKLGRALLDYDGYKTFGIDIVAAFDIDEEKIKLNDKYYHISELSNFLQERPIEIATLTVPKEVAQEITDILVKNGIKVIWNFAPIKLKVPDNVYLEQENLALSLAHLIYNCSGKI